MGHCGRTQNAANSRPMDSHGLCPFFYNSAFTHNFYASQNVYNCIAPDIAEYPENFRMGYMEQRKLSVRGILFCPTTDSYPYTQFLKNFTESFSESENHLETNIEQ